MEICKLYQCRNYPLVKRDAVLYEFLQNLKNNTFCLKHALYIVANATPPLEHTQTPSVTLPN